jgi:hypothetical protein
MIANQGDRAFRRVLGDTLESGTLRLGLIVVAVAVVLGTIVWAVRF